MMNGRVIVALKNNRMFRIDIMKMANVKNIEYDIQLIKQISSLEVVVIAIDPMNFVTYYRLVIFTDILKKR